MMKLSRLANLFVVMVFISACAQSQDSQKQTIGTLLGAGAGALIGSQIGGGKGQLAAVAIGALGGAFLGSEVGKSLDDVDRLKAGKAQQAALENNRSGQVTSWRNPDTGHSGAITPKPAVQTPSGEYCRDYEHEIKVAGRTEVAQGTACRKPNGTWRVIN
ncbi:MAG: RT0821/Lpp0805 family surface protein [Rhodospirillales bacterium]|nr:RT0821/Lpp0805 family surface protein [Rhodospirillales bacterium]